MNSHTSGFYEIFKFSCNRQKYRNTEIFVNRVAIAKIKSASCKLRQLQENATKCIELRTFQECSLAEVESELNFLFHCPSYNWKSNEGIIT